MEDRLHKFATLIDNGSFTKAAAALHVSQPALSTAIQKLERELHAELLVRVSRELRLTDAGRAAYTAAKDLALRTSNLRQQISDINHEQAELAIGMIDSLADTLLSSPDIFTELQNQAHVALTVDNSARLLQALEHDDIAIGFIARQPHRLPRMLDDRLALGDEPLVVVTHPQALSSLQGALKRGVVPHFLSYNQQATTSQLIQAALTTQGLKPLASFYSTSPDILLKLVLANQGTAALPYRMVAAHLQSGQLVVVPGIAPISRPIVAVIRRGRRMSPAIARLCEHMRQVLHSLQLQALDQTAKTEHQPQK